MIKTSLITTKLIKILLTTLTLGLSLLVTAGPTYAQLTGCAYASMQTNDKFKTNDFGGRLGFIVPVDSSRGMYMRTVFGQIDIGQDSTITTIQPTMLMKWYLGRSWDLWWTVGADVYTGGPNGGLDMASGLGVSRKISDKLTIWSEVSMTDAGGTYTGSYAQINLGLAFTAGSPNAGPKDPPLPKATEDQ